MTAILGFNCTDGILLLADTEENFGHYNKSECEKLERLLLPHGVMVLGGAGDSHLIQYASFRARERLLQRPFTGWAEVHDELNNFSKRITAESIGTYKGFDLSALPNLEMLIGVQALNNGVRMFRWTNNTVVPITGLSASIGAGITQMHPMLSDLNSPIYNPYSNTGSCEAMLLHGVRIMRQTKRAIQGCGKRTEAIALTIDNQTRHFGLGNIERLERIVEDFEQFGSGTLAQLISWDMSGDEFEKHLASVPEVLRQLRREYTQTVKSLSLPS
jgi:hypothetical protein